jgi:hypothetical protein
MTRVSCLIGQAFTPRTILRCALSALVALMPLIGAAQGSSIRMAEQPFQGKLPFSPAPVQTSTPAASVTSTATATQSQGPVAELAPTYELRESDKSIRNTFARWARDAGTSVVWQLPDDIPLDAVGPVLPGRSGLTSTDLAVSRFPHLVEAMATVARAFASGRTPIVIREFDNVLLVMGRVEERK